jgi:hypothetical protein
MRGNVVCLEGLGEGHLDSRFADPSPNQILKGKWSGGASQNLTGRESVAICKLTLQFIIY